MHFFLRLDEKRHHRRISVDSRLGTSTRNRLLLFLRFLLLRLRRPMLCRTSRRRRRSGRPSDVREGKCVRFSFAFSFQCDFRLHFRLDAGERVAGGERLHPVADVVRVDDRFDPPRHQADASATGSVESYRRWQHRRHRSRLQPKLE